MRERDRARLAGERSFLDSDAELLGKLEVIGQEPGGLFRWERELLEAGSKRVYSHGRALLPSSRAKLAEILSRRVGAEEHDEEDGPEW